MILFKKLINLSLIGLIPIFVLTNINLTPNIIKNKINNSSNIIIKDVACEIFHAGIQNILNYNNYKPDEASINKWKINGLKLSDTTNRGGQIPFEKLNLPFSTKIPDIQNYYKSITIKYSYFVTKTNLDKNNNDLYKNITKLQLTSNMKLSGTNTLVIQTNKLKNSNIPTKNDFVTKNFQIYSTDGSDTYYKNDWGNKWQINSNNFINGSTYGISINPDSSLLTRCPNYYNLVGLQFEDEWFWKDANKNLNNTKSETKNISSDDQMQYFGANMFVYIDNWNLNFKLNFQNIALASVFKDENYFLYGQTLINNVGVKINEIDFEKI